MIRNERRPRAALSTRAASSAAAAGLLMVAVALLPPGIAAQTITGRVIEAGSTAPIAGAEIRLLDTAAEVIARELSDADGQFLFRDLPPGRYELEVERFGYETRRESPLDLDAEGIRGLEVMLQPVAIPLEEVRVTSRLRRMRHEPTYAGLYARHATSPPMGNNRVILRTDPEFEATMSVRDLLYEFRPGFCEPFVFWRGFYVGSAERDSYARDLVELSVAHVEGIEYYRDYASLPMAYRTELDSAFRGNIPLSGVRRCGVIAIWPRRS